MSAVDRRLTVVCLVQILTVACQMPSQASVSRTGWAPAFNVDGIALDAQAWIDIRQNDQSGSAETELLVQGFADPNDERTAVYLRLWGDRDFRIELEHGSRLEAELERPYTLVSAFSTKDQLYSVEGEFMVDFSEVRRISGTFQADLAPNEIDAVAERHIVGDFQLPLNIECWILDGVETTYRLDSNFTSDFCAPYKNLGIRF